MATTKQDPNVQFAGDGGSAQNRSNKVLSFAVEFGRAKGKFRMSVLAMKNTDIHTLYVFLIRIFFCVYFVHSSLGCFLKEYPETRRTLKAMRRRR